LVAKESLGKEFVGREFAGGEFAGGEPVDRESGGYELLVIEPGAVASPAVASLEMASALGEIRLIGGAGRWGSSRANCQGTNTSNSRPQLSSSGQ
jgi:hypothetical protein